jgi:hypothetical protein
MMDGAVVLDAPIVPTADDLAVAHKHCSNRYAAFRHARFGLRERLGEKTRLLFHEKSYVDLSLKTSR